MTNVALLILRIVTGGLLAGHGSQKLFGWFGGPGLRGAGRWMESIGLRPGEWWAALAGLGELGGGALMLLGLFNPLGPIGVIAVMLMATFKAHWGKPIWATAGGAELPLTNIVIALAVGLAGPGRYSLDAALGIHVPGLVTAIVAIIAAVGVVVGALWPSAEQGAMEQAREAERRRGAA
jgi:putative oxidoreductase